MILQELTEEAAAACEPEEDGNEQNTKAKTDAGINGRAPGVDLGNGDMIDTLNDLENAVDNGIMGITCFEGDFQAGACDLGQKAIVASVTFLRRSSSMSRLDVS